MSEEVVIDRRYRGPPDSANGGYAAGLLAAHVDPDPAVEVTLRAPPPLDRALALLRADDGVPMCFVCGSDRQTDGLRVTCGPVPGRERELVAAPWETDDSMADESGNVRPELVWSVLDCPSGIAGMLEPGQGKSVLGRLTAQIHRPLPAGKDYVAIGWPIGLDGRKALAATAILDREGDAVAVASAVWIVLRDQPAPA